MERKLETRIATDRRGLEEALRLRRLVLAQLEGLPGLAHHEEDPFDVYGEHLVVRDREARSVVGTCRLLGPRAAHRAGGYRAEREFDLSQLDVLRERMVEVGWACIHPDYPTPAIMTMLWSGVSRYLVENGHDHLFATAGVAASDGGHGAAAIYRAVCERAPGPDDLRVFPRRRLPWEVLGMADRAALPGELKAYLNLGAWVCGEPAVDCDYRWASLPVLLPLTRMRGRHARHFLARAA